MGAEMEQPIGYVFEFEDGLARRARSYIDPDRALEAAGVRR
jgi:ketosteroid isomerase-like protein